MIKRKVRKSKVARSGLPVNHRVSFKTKSCEVTWGDRVVFNVRDKKGKIGELRVSVQGLAWVSKLKRKGHKMSWEQFDRLMRDASGWKVPR